MSLAKRLMQKESRRNLQRRATFSQHLLNETLKTLAAILIDHDGRLVVRRENFLLASGLRVDSTPDADGNAVLNLQDTEGKNLYVDQSVHAPSAADGAAQADHARQTEAVHGV